MKRKQLLLASAALTSAIGCWTKKKDPPVIYGNPKPDRYAREPADAGVAPLDTAPADAVEELPDLPGRDPNEPTCCWNPKASLYDDGLTQAPDE